MLKILWNVHYFKKNIFSIDMSKSGRITRSICDRRFLWCGRILSYQLKKNIFWNNEHDSCSSHDILNITITLNCNYSINFLARRLLLVALNIIFYWLSEYIFRFTFRFLEVFQKYISKNTFSPYCCPFHIVTSANSWKYW